MARGRLNKLKTIAGAVAVTLVTFSLVVYPREALASATEGMQVFFGVVFPSLLPFFILSEILLGLGVVHFLGVLLEPLMRPVFNVPGEGAFAMSMGLAAGYPMDAVITAKFRRKGLCTQAEGERLLAFTNTADPLFIFGAVAVGMFSLPQLGIVLAVAHYLSSFSVGFIFRFHRRGERGTDRVDSVSGGMFRRACRALLRARREDGRSIGQMLGEAVRESIGTLLMICGFIMLFSVLVRMMDKFGVIGALTPLIAGLLRLFGLSETLVPAVLRGIFEIDLGTAAAGTAAASLLGRSVIAGFIIAWSGLSVHGQVASVLHGTDIRMRPYIIARFCHAFLAGLYTFLLFPLLTPAVASTMAGPMVRPGLAGRFTMTVWQLALTFGLLIVLAVVVRFSRGFYLAWRKPPAAERR